MAESIVAICNRALDYLGQSPIISLEDGSPPAAILSRSYGPARDKVLRSYPWNCARRRAALPALTIAPAFGFAHSFQLPPDCLRVLNVQDEIEGAITWRVEGRTILSDEAAPLRICYVARIDDVTLFDPMLDDVIAARLAADVAYGITGTHKAQEAMRDLYAEQMVLARRADAREQSSDDALIADAWLGSRI